MCLFTHIYTHIYKLEGYFIVIKLLKTNASLC